MGLAIKIYLDGVFETWKPSRWDNHIAAAMPMFRIHTSVNNVIICFYIEVWFHPQKQLHVLMHTISKTSLIKQPWLDCWKSATLEIVGAGKKKRGCLTVSSARRPPYYGPIPIGHYPTFIGHVSRNFKTKSSLFQKQVLGKFGGNSHNRDSTHNLQGKLTNLVFEIWVYLVSGV